MCSSNANKGAGLVVLTMLSACAAPAGLPPQAAVPAATAGEELSYVVDSQSPSPGALLTVTRAPRAFGYSDGAEAKGVAVKFCTNTNRRLSHDVFGHFVAPAWVFSEGCV